MNIVMIVPTGVGAAIGGHAGDATPAARLLGSVCDNILLHPNVVNASDINEMPNNAWYIEGSILDRFLNREIALYKPKSNRICVAVNPPISPITINAVSSARATLGVDIQIVELEKPLIMDGWIANGGRASGSHNGVESLIMQMSCIKDSFDALAVASPIFVDELIALSYLRGDEDKANPWGYIEAVVSKKIAKGLSCQVAHAPIESGILKDFNEVVDPRKSSEMVSSAYLFCVLKGLHKAPQIFEGYGTPLDNHDIDCMIAPIGCYGPAHDACIRHRIPVIVVEENTVRDPVWDFNDEFIKASTYLEAAGMVSAIRNGISLESLRRPLAKTSIL